MADEFKNILFERTENVATITLNRPPLNVLNIEMMREIDLALEGLKDDNKLKALIFKAQGKAFCPFVCTVFSARNYRFQTKVI